MTHYNLDWETQREVDSYLESIYSQSQDLGRNLANSNLKKNQVHGLETLITSTSRFSEILNYIKNQAGKDKHHGPWRTYAPAMLTQLTDLENQARTLGGDDPAKILFLKLRLARGWARQVVTNYLYYSPH